MPRLCLPGIPQHVIQRGNNHQIYFGLDEDFVAYTYWLDEFSQKYQIEIHAWDDRESTAWAYFDYQAYKDIVNSGAF